VVEPSPCACAAKSEIVRNAKKRSTTFTPFRPAGAALDLGIFDAIQKHLSASSAQGRAGSSRARGARKPEPIGEGDVPQNVRPP